ncbi:flagellar basal body-associated FliL family protein [Dermatophilus congolensis]|uniref:Flagellar protein FliL n=1 Tax=Dermatophilus congolensis TaxID=1863 RepID=A0A239VVE5_9MICO|nr:flagellar basal body-associated FliL family protein [Dermatophilus congolensis]MBO3129985.1 flagellar basal body-associated FliL family protein [Dermatophilus congolensis]MBO3131385.1 flagellar basal body-associated FliL family protein [Dermatophilus congolensis]MBO3134459.1 flagellar basal body-associated FliL family protein [Dermatophilus congolensis]MBO3136694.1 flagellar basal body-associated FliL family protein [Dermatophilus congolensis]MBO3138939.1 flagellar basal body-associated Fli
MADSEEDDKKSGGNKKLIIILVAALVVVLVAAGVIVMMLLGGNKEPEPDPATQNGAVYAMKDPMTLNLADGKFLKVNLAIQMSKAGDEHLTEAGVDAAKGPDLSKARDAAIEILSKYKYSDLLQHEKKSEAQETLSKEVKKRYDGDVLSVYFTEFVMQ